MGVFASCVGAESAISTSAAAGVPFVIGVSDSRTGCAGLGDGSAILVNRSIWNRELKKVGAWI